MPMKRLCFAVVALFGAALSPAWAQTSLVFGAYTSEQATSLVDQLRPALDAVARRLSDDTGKPVTIRIQIASSYEDGVRLIVNRRVDFMRVGAASYISAKEKDKAIALLAVESMAGKSER